MKQCFRLFLVLILGLNGIQVLRAQEKKYMNHTEFGVMAYDMTFQEAGITAQTFNGYLLKPDLAIGGTAGFEKYAVDAIHTFSSVPISLGARYTFLDPGKARLISGLDAGYGFIWENEPRQKGDISGGIRIAPELGVKLKLSEGTGFISFTLGYQYQAIKAKYTQQKPPIFEPYVNYIQAYPIDEYAETKKMDAHRFSLKVGFGF